MGKKRHFKFLQQSSTPDVRQGYSSSSSSSVRQDGTPQVLEPRSSEFPLSTSSSVNEQLQLLRESSRARPTRAAIEDFVQASTAPSRPPEMTSSLNAHNYGNEQQPSAYSRMMLRTMRCFQNGQEIVFVNRARRGQAGRWVRTSNPNEMVRGTGRGISVSENQRASFRLQNGTKLNKGFPKLSRDAEGASALPRPGSLLDISLRTMAQNWMFVREYEINNLDILPGHLGSQLVLYLGIYAPSGTVNLDTLKILVKREDMESMRMLDLTGCVSHRFSVKDVLNYLKNGGFPQQTSLESAFDPSKIDKEAKALADQTLKSIEELSWDQQLKLMSRGVSLPSLPTVAGLSIASPFENLTHLSLAHPSPGSRPWFYLFRMTKAPLALTRLTHFSLAYWPSPFNDSERTEPTSASGYQDDSILHPQQLLLARMAYKASLASNGAWPGLKKLAKFTPRLEVLDLEGCTDWALCLVEKRRTWTESASHVVGRYDFNQRNIGGSGATRVLDEIPFLMAHWDELSVVHLSQGFIPATPESEGRMNESTIKVKLGIYLENRMRLAEYDASVQYEGGSNHDFDGEVQYSVESGSADLNFAYEEWHPELRSMDQNETDQWLDKEERVESAAKQLIKGITSKERFRKGILATGTFPKRI